MLEGVVDRTGNKVFTRLKLNVLEEQSFRDDIIKKYITANLLVYSIPVNLLLL